MGTLAQDIWKLELDYFIFLPFLLFVGACCVLPMPALLSTSAATFASNAFNSSTNPLLYRHLLSVSSSVLAMSSTPPPQSDQSPGKKKMTSAVAAAASTSSAVGSPSHRPPSSSAPPAPPPRTSVGAAASPHHHHQHHGHQQPHHPPPSSSAPGPSSSPWQSPRPKTRSQHLSTQARSQSVQQKVKTVVPKLTYDLYKGQCGRICIFGGCFMYTGAPYFAAISALRTGCDLVHIMCEKEAGQVREGMQISYNLALNFFYPSGDQVLLPRAHRAPHPGHGVCAGGDRPVAAEIPRRSVRWVALFPNSPRKENN